MGGAVDRRARHADHRRDDAEGEGRPTRCCSARSAARNGTSWASSCARRSRSCGCARNSDLFANLRPAIVLDPLVDASTLKPEVVRGLDLMIVRESTGGIYFGEPRGVETLPDGERRGFDTESYTTSEIERVARVAFELARKRSNRVCQRGEGQRDAVRAVLAPDRHRAARARISPTWSSSHMYADNCAMQLVRNPRQFDVIVTSNIFGDLLSDLASMLTGSLGMLPSATLGAAEAVGQAATRCTSRSTAARLTSPARASPTHWRRS